LTWFKTAFPDETEPASFVKFDKAIEACEATLTTPARCGT